MHEGMRCIKCKKEMRIMVDMTVSAPSSMESCFTKKNMMKKEFRIYGVSWERANYICECGYVFRMGCRWCRDSADK